MSLTSICCKVLEHIVAKALLCHLESNKILIENQHGFRHSRPCKTQLLMFVDEFLRSMSKGKQIDALIMDFSKAFDMVPHNSLLVKISGYGVQDKTLAWIGSFLSDRSQRVVVEGEQSDPAPVTSGVAQGSVLGPILFLVFINDLPKAIDSSCHLFANDTIVYREISSPADSAAPSGTLYHQTLSWQLTSRDSKILSPRSMSNPSTPTNCAVCAHSSF